MTKTFFYVVAWREKHGIDVMQMHKYLKADRRIRWESSGAEYGLIEAEVTRDIGNPHSMCQIRDVGRERDSQIYIERIKEIALTEAEAKELGFGWPL